MEKQRLLIADPTEEIRLTMEDLLREDFCIKCAGDGKETLELLQSFEPELVITDLRLPGINGMELLRSISRLDLQENTLVLTTLTDPCAIGMLWEMGIRHILQKPCDLSAVVEEIRQIAGISMERTQPAQLRITELLLELGLSAKHDGYHYLRDAVVIYGKNPRQALTKELYCSVGDIYGATGSQVERSIRNAVAIAWNHGDKTVWQHYFSGEKPSNGKVISTISEHLAMERFLKII